MSLDAREFNASFALLGNHFEFHISPATIFHPKCELRQPKPFQGRWPLGARPNTRGPIRFRWERRRPPPSSKSSRSNPPWWAWPGSPDRSGRRAANALRCLCARTWCPTVWWPGLRVFRSWFCRTGNRELRVSARTTDKRARTIGPNEIAHPNTALCSTRVVPLTRRRSSILAKRLFNSVIWLSHSCSTSATSLVIASSFLASSNLMLPIRFSMSSLISLFKYDCSSISWHIRRSSCTFQRFLRAVRSCRAISSPKLRFCSLARSQAVENQSKRIDCHRNNGLCPRQRRVRKWYLFVGVWWLHRSIPIRVDFGLGKSVLSLNFGPYLMHDGSPGTTAPIASISSSTAPGLWSMWGWLGSLSTEIGAESEKNRYDYHFAATHSGVWCHMQW